MESIFLFHGMFVGITPLVLVLSLAWVVEVALETIGLERPNLQFEHRARGTSRAN